MRTRATNLNAKSHDGTTPLILAVRLAIEEMVIGLISAESDINAADNNGKTALHWAAAISNIEAVKQLLKNGANKDAQDEKVSLFVHFTVPGMICRVPNAPLIFHSLLQIRNFEYVKYELCQVFKYSDLLIVVFERILLEKPTF